MTTEEARCPAGALEDEFADTCPDCKRGYYFCRCLVAPYRFGSEDRA